MRPPDGDLKQLRPGPSCFEITFLILLTLFPTAVWKWRHELSNIWIAGDRLEEIRHHCSYMYVHTCKTTAWKKKTLSVNGIWTHDVELQYQCNNYFPTNWANVSKANWELSCWKLAISLYMGENMNEFNFYKLKRNIFKLNDKDLKTRSTVFVCNFCSTVVN